MTHDIKFFPSNKETLIAMEFCSSSLVPQRDMKRRSHTEQGGFLSGEVHVPPAQGQELENEAELRGGMGNMRYGML